MKHTPILVLNNGEPGRIHFETRMREFGIDLDLFKHFTRPDACEDAVLINEPQMLITSTVASDTDYTNAFLRRARSKNPQLWVIAYSICNGLQCDIPLFKGDGNTDNKHAFTMILEMFRGSLSGAQLQEA